MIYLASIWVIPVIVAITFHEAAHGFVARLFGDETAWRLGRVSFNPLKHIDPVGTILLPGLLLLLHSPFLFGYAKPVPINFRALRNPRRDMIWVAAAGPAMNIALAIVAALAVPPHRLPAGNRGAMGRGELKERADHQCRVGRLQLVSASATRWRTHRCRRAPGRRCLPACPARALRYANPHRSPLHPADAGGAIGSRPQHHLASNLKLDRRHHRRHTSIDWQHLTICSRYWLERSARGGCCARVPTAGPCASCSTPEIAIFCSANMRRACAASF